MTERSVVTRFEAKDGQYLASVAKMQGATEKFAKAASASATKHKADWDKVTKSTLVGGAVIGSVVVAAVKQYMDFEKAMSGVVAVTDANTAQQAKLAEAARSAGKATVFSATEAAKAEAELAKAGVSVKDILSGGLNGALNLAAAGQIDLADAATISAQAMNIFKLSGKDVGHIADVLTAGANKSAAGVDDLGLALQQGGLLAKQTGLSMEDTVGVLSAFADNALRGSDAGTSLKTMLQRLTPQSVQQADAMKSLGLSFYDANGQFVGITEAAQRMQVAFRNLTPEQRNSAMATIFGSDAVRGANILYEQGAKGIQTYIDAVNDQGAAQRMASKQTDNLAGDFEKLKGSISDALIGGGQGSAGPLRSLVQGVTDLVDKFGQLSPVQQSAIVKGAALTAGLLLAVAGAAKAVTMFQSYRDALVRAGIPQDRLAAGAKALGKALAAAAIAAQVSKIGNDDTSLGVNKLTKDLLDGKDAADSLSQTWTVAAKRAQGFDSPIRSLGDALDVALNPSKLQSIDDAGGKLLETFGGSNLSDIQFAKQRLGELDAALSQLVANGRKDDADRVFGSLARAAAKAGYSTDQLMGVLPQYQEALDSTAVSAKDAGDATSQLDPVAKANAKSAEDAAQATKDWADALDGLNQPALDARAAARKVEEAVDGVTSSIKDNGKSLDIHTEKGRKNQAALDDVAKALNDQIGAMRANGASQGELQGKLDTSRTRLFSVARQFGLTKQQAWAYVNQVLRIPPTKTTTATFKVVGLTALQQAGQYLRSLQDKHVTLTVGTVKVGNTRVNAGQFAGGGELDGPGTKTSDSIPIWASKGEFVMKAAAVDKYGVGMMHAINAGRFADGGFVGAQKFADGGQVDFQAIMSILGDITTLDDVNSAKASSSSKARSLASARIALQSLINQQRKASRDLAAARKAHDHNRINDILDRQRLLLGKVAAAEGKVAAARIASAAAAKKTAAVEAEYRADRRPLIDRTLSAAASTNKSTKTFLDNIDRLTSMGFKTLGLELLQLYSSDPATAAGLAAAAVKSTAKAKSLQSQFVASAALDAREQAMLGTLSGDLPALGGAFSSQMANYARVRDLGGLIRSGRYGAHATPTYVFSPTVQTGVGDRAAITREMIDLLVEWQNTHNRDLPFLEN